MQYVPVLLHLSFSCVVAELFEKYFENATPLCSLKLGNSCGACNLSGLLFAKVCMGRARLSPTDVLNVTHVCLYVCIHLYYKYTLLQTKQNPKDCSHASRESQSFSEHGGVVYAYIQTDRHGSCSTRLCGARSGSPQFHTLFHIVGQFH